MSRENKQNEPGQIDAARRDTFIKMGKVAGLGSAFLVLLTTSGSAGIWNKSPIHSPPVPKERWLGWRKRYVQQKKAQRQAIKRWAKRIDKRRRR